MAYKKFLIIIITLLLSSIVYSQDYAPIAPIPENPEHDPDIALGIMILESVNVPDKKEVGIPAYPGSQIIQTSERTEDMLPSIRLVSDDSTKYVIEFYKNELTDWKYEDFYGVYMFWNGEDKMKAMMAQAPVVQVESNEKFSHLVPSAKTTILIGYMPAN